MSVLSPCCVPGWHGHSRAVTQAAGESTMQQVRGSGWSCWSSCRVRSIVLAFTVAKEARIC